MLSYTYIACLVNFSTSKAPSWPSCEHDLKGSGILYGDKAFEEYVVLIEALPCRKIEKNMIAA